MRLSSLGSGFRLAAVLLLSSTVFAQHHEASAPSSPPPSAAPSPAPVPSPAPAPAPAPSAPASVSFSHADVSAAVAARAPESHIDSGGSAGSRASSSTFTQPTGTAPTSTAERVIPANKISNDDKVTTTPRIGETSPDKERILKREEPDLRHRICMGSDCKEPVVGTNPPQSDLRHHICPGGACHCPPGETASKGGCVAAPVVNEPVYQDQSQFLFRCPSGQWWDGASCRWPALGCASITSRAEVLLDELRSLAPQVRDACSSNSTSTDCADVTTRRDDAVQRYRTLQNEATQDCRAQLPEPPL